MSVHIQKHSEMLTIEVGDLEFDGMQGDTVACGQHWQTLSPFPSTRSLKI